VSRRLLINGGCLLLLCIPATLWAQEGRRQGFWIGAGAGPAFAQIDCNRCGPLFEGDAWAGGTGYGGFLAMGGTAGPNLLIGGEVNAYLRSSTSRVWDSFYARDSSLEREAILGTVALVAQFYPISGAPAFLKGGFGFGHYELGTRSQLPLGEVQWSHDSSGWALQAGLGYDLLLSAQTAVVPFANVVQLSTKGVEWVGGSGPTSPRYVQLGIGLYRY
jgi:hypothetical protein